MRSLRCTEPQAVGKSFRAPLQLALLAALLMALLMLRASPLQAMPAALQSGPITLEAFWQKVKETREWLKAGHNAQAREGKAQEWEAVQSVTLPDGQTLPLDTRQLAELLRKNPPDAKAAGDYLNALEQANERWNQAGSKTVELGSLKEILARKEFSGRAESAIERFFRQLYEGILDLLQKLFPNNSDTEIPLLPPWVTISIAAALLLGVLAYIFRDTWRNMLSEVELAEETAGEEEILSSQQATRRAQQLSGSGDYRQAVRYLYLSALLLLDERGLLRYNRSQTNREYLRQVAGSPRLASNLRAVVDTFDRVWYGYQGVDEAEYARYAEQVSALEEEKSA